MGSKSSSKSDQTSTNTSQTFGVQGSNYGQMINGSGNTITDGGAFDMVGDFANYTLPELSQQIMDSGDNTINAAIDLAKYNRDTTTDFIDGGIDLFGEASDAQRQMLDVASNALGDASNMVRSNAQDAFDFAGKVADQSLFQVGDITDTALNANRQITQDAIDGNQDLAVLVADSLADANSNNTTLAKYSMDNSAYLAQNLSEQVRDANSDAFKQLSGGFESIMNWANDFSRSDGADLAKTNNQTMLLMLGGLSATALAVAYVMRRK